MVFGFLSSLLSQQKLCETGGHAPHTIWSEPEVALPTLMPSPKQSELSSSPSSHFRYTRTAIKVSAAKGPRPLPPAPASVGSPLFLPGRHLPCRLSSYMPGISITLRVTDPPANRALTDIHLGPLPDTSEQSHCQLWGIELLTSHHQPNTHAHAHILSPTLANMA